MIKLMWVVDFGEERHDDEIDGGWMELNMVFILDNERRWLSLPVSFLLLFSLSINLFSCRIRWRILLLAVNGVFYFYFPYLIKINQKKYTSMKPKLVSHD
jgi:hypothetical protein